MGSSIHHRPAARGEKLPQNDSVNIVVAGLEGPATVPLEKYLKKFVGSIPGVFLS